MTNEIIIKKQISPIVAQAEALTITDRTTMTVGVEILSKANKALDSITTERERVTRPLNEALKAERSRWKPLETVLTGVIDSIRSKMSAYQTAEVVKQKEAEAKIAARLEKGTLKVETAMKKMEAIKIPEKETSTNEGLVQFRESKVLKITESNQIPDQYWKIDEALLLKDLKEGKVIPGAEVDIIQIPVNYR